jgi:S1-C subfamily serine protease
MPWQKLAVQSSSGTGFLIEGQRILTNAHVVANSKYLQVRKFGDPKLYKAKVEIIGNDCDLALINVEDKSFFEGIQPLEIGDLPKIMDEVIVLGYPIGGDEINITKGIVSRVEHINYTYSFYSFLGCQIDASINPGNSGGPVISRDKVVGVAFEGNSSKNLSYMISPPIIHHFLKDVEDNKYDGFSDLLIKYQNMINEDLRSFHKMPPKTTGILVVDISPESPACDIIKKGDVLTEIDGIAIANDGSVEFRPGERTEWAYLTDNKFVGEEIVIKYIRDGKVAELKLKMKKLTDTKLVPYVQDDSEPKFFIFGGIIFQSLSLNYLQTYGRYWYNDAPRSFINEFYSGEISKETKEVVIISDILPDDVNDGYSGLSYDFIVSKINDKPISTLDEMIKLVEKSEKGFIIFESRVGQKLIVDAVKIRNSNPSILEKYNISKDRSDIYKK